MRIFLVIVFIVSCGQNLAAQESGWQADRERIEQLEEERPGYNWRESGVPDYELPEVLRTTSGSTVQNKEEWPRRRRHILELFRTHMYGRRPGPPEELSFEVVQEDPQAMKGRATLRRVAIKSRHEGRRHEFELILFLPNDVSGAIPVFMLMNNRAPSNTDPTRKEKSGFWPAEEVIDRGYGIAAIQNNDLAPDDEDRYHEGVIRLFEGEDASVDREADAWMALAAWGWGASRVMDYFESESGIDNSKVALLGHSRGGKAALWAGAEDTRFSIVISNNSGSGGAALSRRRFGETVKAVNGFDHWFAENYMAFNDREEALPFDQHMLISLMAPRAVYIASAGEDLWADPRGEFLSLAHASPAYGLWGYEAVEPDEMPPLDQPLVAGPRGYHIRSGGHNLTPEDWNHYMDFADRWWNRGQ
ncbi:glucuronyl esterase domain-containing protein [Fodinibius sediminis]|uniref:glucuronyl esterase domain-containing protein n=1 Tax=Fodinibius sediminis TaxID=1214077 RepID=UPI001C8F8A50|nr:hypothetical protein [Fodinibius sediminis]